MQPPLTASTTYRGRFAPTPSGPLHFGSLVTAVASWLEARSHQGQWLVRMEDLDPPREAPGAADHILHTLEAFGLTWDGSVMYQSQRHAAYQQQLDQLIQAGHAYPCSCSRKALEGHHRYPGWCRSAPQHPDQPLAWRLRVDDQVSVQWQDQVQGPQCWPLQQAGDVVIRRKDQLWAYQLAVVVDDLKQGMTHILRGIDLIDSTPWQIWLQVCMGRANSDAPAFQYAHLPVIVNAVGQKLSKQNLAPALDTARISSLLMLALQALGQQPDPALQQETPETLLHEAIHFWQLDKVPAVAAISETDLKPCISIA
ncbi:tRNA glutamyl-Q(34) synthetase GluQRS [Marinospirillum alkaliphilum]|uniref:Glutamyl-Q tRNA(Asp) synthetase n=1 Tax=Marinospirillum alkaliphilum DSM 21637 TaxID=1122209 RepID=A0A1K1WJM1_9GAMM|nr:tRNA glutamyl-Q(34) synthetase GluQRS [Marinospirillum alkaliphilum]SFX36981.1 glutamyl-Q tRNA(Asp) synthetase [Marinospirillum alkaliphilum DSM 21637]